MAMGFLVENKREEESPDVKYMKGVRHLCDSGITRVPTRYILPISDRPTSHKGKGSSPPAVGNVRLPIIDLSELRQGPNRAHVLQSLAKACEEHGFFQVVNHGVPAEVLRSMVDVSRRFFELPFEERAVYMSADIFAPVRYGTSFNQSKDGVLCWRDFLKLSCHPLPGVLPHWPSSPLDLRQVTISYAQQTRNLFLVLMGAILETLGMEDGPIMEEFRDGTQMMVANFFPECPEPDLTLGMPPHSDYGFLTLVLQDGVRGLQIQHQGSWVTIQPATADSLVVNVGDHLEPKLSRPDSETGIRNWDPKLVRIDEEDRRGSGTRRGQKRSRGSEAEGCPDGGPTGAKPRLPRMDEGQPTGGVAEAPPDEERPARGGAEAPSGEADQPVEGVAEASSDEADQPANGVETGGRRGEVGGRDRLGEVGEDSNRCPCRRRKRRRTRQ